MRPPSIPRRPRSHRPDGAAAIETSPASTQSYSSGFGNPPCGSPVSAIARTPHDGLFSAPPLRSSLVDPRRNLNHNPRPPSPPPPRVRPRSPRRPDRSKRPTASTYYVSNRRLRRRRRPIPSPPLDHPARRRRRRAGDTAWSAAAPTRNRPPLPLGSSSARITYKPYTAKRVTVSGADRVSGWSKHSGSVYKADQTGTWASARTRSSSTAA